MSARTGSNNSKHGFKTYIIIKVNDAAMIGIFELFLIFRQTFNLYQDCFLELGELLFKFLLNGLNLFGLVPEMP